MAQLPSCIQLINNFVTLCTICKLYYKSHNPLCTTIAVYHVHNVQAVSISLAATFEIIGLFSFRPVTKMFQFTGFPPHNLCIQLWVIRFKPYRVSPFGILRIKTFQQFPAAYRSFTRLSSAVSTKAFPISSLQLYLIYRVYYAKMSSSNSCFANTQ